MIYVDGASVYLPRGETASFDIVFGDILPEDVNNPAVWLRNDEIPENGTKIRIFVNFSHISYDIDTTLTVVRNPDKEAYIYLL